MPTPKRPARPTDPLVWQEKLTAELDRTARTSTGSLQAMLTKMHALVSRSRPGDTLDKRLFNDLQEAFSLFVADPASGGAPQLILECMEWLDVCFMAPMAAANSGGGTGSKRAVTPPVPGDAKKPGGDSFDSSSAARARSSTGEVPSELSFEKQQKDLESIKNWMMNPGLGKVKG